MTKDIEEDHDDSEECDDAVSYEKNDNFEDIDFATTAYGISVSDNEQDRIVLENDDEFN